MATHLGKQISIAGVSFNNSQQPWVIVFLYIVQKIKPYLFVLPHTFASVITDFYTKAVTSENSLLQGSNHHRQEYSCSPYLTI